jgi:L-idonate 5-dehydrogenase
MKALRIYGKKQVQLEDVADISGVQLESDQVLVRNTYCGICGSDLSYFNKGGSGTFQIQTPFIFGHEFAGEVVAVGSNVTEVQVGEKGAVCPIDFLPVENLPKHLEGKDNLYPKITFYGSAAFPDINGGLVEYKIIKKEQFIKINVTDEKLMALAEPLAVAIHGVRRAETIGEIDYDAPILVNGAGPVGLLILAYLKHQGAKNVIVSDIHDAKLDLAKKLGADTTVNVTDPNVAFPAGYLLAFEASGFFPSVQLIAENIASAGNIVQVGNLPLDKSEISLAQLVSKEINYIGSFRWDVADFKEAANAIENGINVADLVTDVFELSQFEQAFERAVQPDAGKIIFSISSGDAR